MFRCCIEKTMDLQQQLQQQHRLYVYTFVVHQPQFYIYFIRFLHAIFQFLFLFIFIYLLVALHSIENKNYKKNC